MVSCKKINSLDEIREIQRLATLCPHDVGFHSLDGTIIFDAKSYIGMYTLNFNEPILVVSEDEEFHEKIKDIGENV